LPTPLEVHPTFLSGPHAMTRTLTPSELLAMEVTERVTSALSLVGFSFILITYLCYEEFNKPINRLIFYASWSNLGTTVAGLIGERGVVAGQNSTLCQGQAFIIQMCVECHSSISSLTMAADAF
jgi:hypothetical protein